MAETFDAVRDPPRRYPRPRLHTLLLAVIAAGIVHISMTLAWPYWTSSTPVRRIMATLPPDVMQLLPVPTPKTQIYAFQGPDVRYAACRFNVSEAAYAVRATLPDAGWSLSVHNATGDSVYMVTGQEQKRTDVAVLVLPPGDRFIGVLPESRLAAGFAQVPVTGAEGIVLIRAPDRGVAYQAEMNAELSKATCLPRRS
jgi:uncharacterized membrane protein